MLNVFIGYDHRQPISYAVAHFSLIRRSSIPLTVAPLKLDTLPIEAQGLTPFTYSRWLVPYLMENDGWALFMDADELVLGDIAELYALRDERYAVQVVKHQKTFEWPSVMLFNCGHPACRELTPEYVDSGRAPKWDWLPGGTGSDLIGSLPSEWNHLVGYDKPRNDAKLVHYTAGVPCWPETQMCEYSEAWHQEAQDMMSAIPWAQLMGNSVHAARLPDGRVLPHFHPDVAAAQSLPENPVDMALKAAG